MPTKPKATAPAVDELIYTAPDGSVLVHTIEVITPEWASKWVTEDNTHNRNKRDKRVASYSRDMTTNNWPYLGDPLRFAEDGTMLDGQHRCEAIRRSGKEQVCLVIRGFRMSAQELMDIGAGRTLSDVLGLRDEIATSALAAIMRRVVLWRNGQLPIGGHTTATHSELLAFLDGSPDARDAAKIAVASRAAGFHVPPSVIGAAWFLCAEKSREGADDFIVRQLIEGVGVVEGSPAYLLARKFRASGAAGGLPRLTPNDAFMFLLWAWNSHRRNVKPATKMQGPPGGWPAPKDFTLR